MFFHALLSTIILCLFVFTLFIILDYPPCAINNCTWQSVHYTFSPCLLMNVNLLLILSLIQHFLFSIMTLMSINKSITDVPRKPYLHLHHQKQTTSEEWKKTCYNFTILPILLSKRLINLCQHTFETKIKNTDSLTPGVGYRKTVLLQWLKW